MTEQHQDHSYKQLYNPHVNLILFGCYIFLVRMESTKENMVRTRFVKKYFTSCCNRIKTRCKGKVTVPESAEELFGCSTEQLAQIIEAQFHHYSTPDRNMTWAYYGDWHIDHIEPVNTFKNLDQLTEQMECFHFFNVRPLWASENIRGSKRRLEYPAKPASKLPKNDEHQDRSIMQRSKEKRLANLKNWESIPISNLRWSHDQISLLRQKIDEGQAGESDKILLRKLLWADVVGPEAAMDFIEWEKNHRNQTSYVFLSTFIGLAGKPSAIHCREGWNMNGRYLETCNLRAPLTTVLNDLLRILGLTDMRTIQDLRVPKTKVDEAANYIQGLKKDGQLHVKICATEVLTVNQVFSKLLHWGNFRDATKPKNSPNRSYKFIWDTIAGVPIVDLVSHRITHEEDDE